MMADDQLISHLRAYSVNNVKIQEADYEWAKGLLNEYVNKSLCNYIRRYSNIPLRNLEYTGSHYEHLKTEAADEIDVMVVLDSRKYLCVEKIDEIPGWVKLKAKNGDSPFTKYINTEKYLLIDKMRQWLISLVNKAKNHFATHEYKDGAVAFEVREHGPAVQLDITDAATGKMLSVDLVLSFQFENDFYVAKPYKVSPTRKHVLQSNTLLRQSFSVKEKHILKDMDKMDSGCRHELLRIVKTIVRNDSALKGKLTTYHLKTAFLRYNSDQTISWHRNDLSQRFLDYITVIIEALNNRKLPHFFLPEINLLEDIDCIVCNNMACRLERLLNSGKERNKILKVSVSDSLPLVKQMDSLSLRDGISNTVPPSKGTLELIRRFVDDMGKTSKTNLQNTKTVFNQVVTEKILKNCKECNPEFISKFEYCGNLFEGLFTEGQDDDDAVVIVILKTKKNNSNMKPDVGKGFATFKATQDSQYAQFCQSDQSEMFIDPHKLADWFFKVIQREAQKCSSTMGISVTPPQPGSSHVVKLIINLNSLQPKQRKGSSLTVLLLPAFIVEDKYFVPLEPLCTGSQTCRWKRCFAMEKKAVLNDMDKDGGCRHDLFKVVSTILKREASFAQLLVHTKMMFVIFIHEGKDETSNKWMKDKLDERFEEFLIFIADILQEKKMMHFWQSDVNLLYSIADITIVNMEKRIRRILSSHQEKEKVLTF